jgi:putative ABC transport system permease protein
MDRDQEDRELAEEIESHLRIEEQQRREAGDAHPAVSARKAFGSTARIHEDTRATWRGAGLERFAEDVRFGIRMLRKTPVWTCVIGGTLALGIGLSTAIFSLLYGVLLQPLPYPDPSRLMAIWPTTGRLSTERFNVGGAMWAYWREHARSFEGIGLTRPLANFNFTGDGPAERLQGARTTFDIPLLLGVRPLHGRVFTEQEQQADAKVAILSYGLWQRRFGGRPEVVGHKIQMNGEPYEVIGIMPAEYRYPTRDFELWTPLFIPRSELRHGWNHQYYAVARLKPGVTRAQAQAEMTGLMDRLAREEPSTYVDRNDHTGALVQPLAESDALRVKGTLYVLIAAVGCLLLIGCMNLAVLLIARATARAREMAVRIALGASHARLRRQMLAEVLPLSLAGTAGGLLVAWWMLQALLPLLPASTPRIETIGLQGPVLAFAIVVSLAVVMLASLLPAATLPGALTTPGASQRGGPRNALVIAQVAITLILLFAGLLFARSFSALLQVDPGFAPHQALTMHLAVTRAQFPEDAQIAAYYQRLIDRVRSVPGVTAAGFVNRLPLSGLIQNGGIAFEGRETPLSAEWRAVTPGYFDALGIPLKRGRLFAESDRTDSPAVCLIDEQLARQIYGNTNPIGQRLRRRFAPDMKQDPWAEIVGVVGHILNETLETDPRPQVYWPTTQRAQDRGALVVRTAGAPESFTTAVIEQIPRENPNQPVYDVRTMEAWVDRTLQSRTLLTGLVALFGGASLVLACLGLYGVVSYSAELRLREFGIRLALGAGAAHVRRIVLNQTAKLALAGAALGLILAWPVGRAIESLLYAVRTTDPLSWAAAPILLLCVALLAGLVPATRAARTDPAVTLRAD